MTLDDLFADAGFAPNAAQRQAVTHGAGPLFLVAGPGSGKTRVLLWRVLDLIVFRDVPPGRIFLATFTEKAAKQLSDGLLSLLGLVTNRTGRAFDLAPMYVGTVHSLCHRILRDRAFSPARGRLDTPAVYDELDQYFLLSKSDFWKDAATCLPGIDGPKEIQARVNELLGGKASYSKHKAVTELASLFNRLSEENLDPAALLKRRGDANVLFVLYDVYLKSLAAKRATDLSLIQQAAWRLASDAKRTDGAGHFEHVIVDEYQDTNAIQEKLYVALAGRHGNLCVVGDDDQALYRFRGATVENFVRFPERCLSSLGLKPTRIALATNYRSRPGIVSFYTTFIDHGTDWHRPEGGYYRLHDKGIKAHRTDPSFGRVRKGARPEPAVVASAPGTGEVVAAELAGLIRRLVDDGKVADPNQIAVLFPSLKGKPAERLQLALEEVGLRVYAPRAKRFLEAEEPTIALGLLARVIGTPERSADYDFGEYKEFHDWLNGAHTSAKLLESKSPDLKAFVKARRAEIAQICKDRAALLATVDGSGWAPADAYSPAIHKHRLLASAGLSDGSKRGLGGRYLDKIAAEREAEGTPFTLQYIVNRATSLDWNLLDLFYRFCAFEPLTGWFEQAENGSDEGPVCNLALTSQLLARYADKFPAIITAKAIDEQWLERTFYQSFLYAMFRRGEGEHEDADDPFPRGRIPFLTIHQSKGLEFPVVVLGTTFPPSREPRTIEKLVRPLLSGDSEPLERMGDFDVMRMYYVALSRAKNLMVVAHFRGRGQRVDPSWKLHLGDAALFPRIADLDLDSVPDAKAETTSITHRYSYTGDYLAYLRCARQYMLFQKYDFAPSRAQTMFFGSLVHATIEDLHNHLIGRRQSVAGLQGAPA